MKEKIFLFTFSIFSLIGFSQNGLGKELKSIEKNIESNSMNGFKKLEVDLDNDNDLDYIFLYQCSESKCLEVYMNIDDELEKVIFEYCYDFFLYENNYKKDLKIKLNHCCGESPFTSIKSYNFEHNKSLLKDSYVIFNDSYELLYPEVILEEPYQIKITNDNYNIRFAPNIKEYSEGDSMFSCEPKTNVIGKLKIDSKLTVLSKLIKEKRTWLFVEIDNSQLVEGLCKSPIDYEFKNQKLRAWISAKFVEKT